MDTNTAHEASCPSSPSSPTSSSSSSIEDEFYDVFLSFGGEDTRKTFTDHLYWTLKAARVDTFIEEESTSIGETISDKVKQAIQGSRIAVIIFSRRYADSIRCLEELVKIMECKRTMRLMVLPIFYDVDPSDVKYQSGTFAEAFQKHEGRFHQVKDKEEKLRPWRNALTEAADLPGEDFAKTDGYQGVFITKIVDEITRKLKSTSLGVAMGQDGIHSHVQAGIDSHLQEISYYTDVQVGLDSRVQEICNYLDGVGGSNDVRMIGICGMDGIGKTTVAKAIFDKYHHGFDGKSFLQVTRGKKLVELREQLVNDILDGTNMIKVSSVAQGTKEIKKRLQSLRVLVIIDDLVYVEELNELDIKPDWFGPGSRIIITTRDKNLLGAIRVDVTRDIQPMTDEEALQLFSWHAFRNHCPNEGYLELSREVVHYCGGLPLALEVLGSYLCRKSTAEWKNTLGKLKIQPDWDVCGKVKISYDGLTHDLKEIFICICCSFIGKNKDYILKMLNGHHFDLAKGIEKLHELCLVTVDKEGNLMMHDMIQDMGREIVLAASSGNHEKLRSLWIPEDAKGFLRNNSGMREIIGLSLDLHESDKTGWSTEPFQNMKSLKLLHPRGLLNQDDVVDVLRTTRVSYKVHRLMCTELLRLVDRISRILPEIEAARPRCSTGIQALCLLNHRMEEAKLLLQYCSESSKLYLAVTGDVMVSIFQRSRNLLEQSLLEIQNWVPVMLVMELSQIAKDLKGSTFILDPYEEEAGRVVRELLHSVSSQSDPRKDSEIKAFQIASLRLHITSPNAILIEKRSIKKMLEKVGEHETRKKKILVYFMYLLSKHGNLITELQQGTFAAENSGNGFESNQCAEVEPHVGYGESQAQSNLFRGAVPPEEFMCGISYSMMYDPVVIDSGQTYEKMWIQKWFSEGHDTCPKTNMKLKNLSLTPNINMKELISRWCTQYGVVLPDPSMQPEVLSWETSSTSIRNSGSSMNDLHDFSSISFGSLDTGYDLDDFSRGSLDTGYDLDDFSSIFGSLCTGYDSDSSRNTIENGLSLVQNDNDSLKYQYAKKCETGAQFLSELGELQWESQCKAVEDVKNHLKCDPEASYAMSSKNFVEPLIKFLRDARDLDDAKAQKEGFKLLLTFVRKNRNGIPNLREEAYSLLAYYIDSKVTEEVIAIMEVVSGHQYCRSKVSESGALTSIVKLLDSQNKDFQGQAIKILHNLSLDKDICSKIVSLECVPKLVSFFKDDVLSGVCISILKNLCDTEEARISIAASKGCIASIAELLETGSSEDQEHAVDILLSLCSHRDEYCQLVMHEGVIPSLIYLSNNGTERAMTSALGVLRLLRDLKYVDEHECSGSADLDASRNHVNRSTERKSPKTSGFFGKKMSMFSKPSSLTPKKKK